MRYEEDFWKFMLEWRSRGQYIGVSRGTKAMIDNGECGLPRISCYLPPEQRIVSMVPDALCWNRSLH